MYSEVKEEVGLIFSKDKFNVVKKAGAKGDKVPKHNHPEANIIFTVVKGKVKVAINDNELHELSPGKVLYFDGDNYISAEFIEDGEFIVNLINK